MFTDENREMTYSNHVSCWQMNCLRRLLIEELVKESDVCKRSSGHHGVVPSARTVGVEIPSSQTDQNTKKKKKKSNNVIHNLGELAFIQSNQRHSKS